MPSSIALSTVFAAVGAATQVISFFNQQDAKDQEKQAQQEAARALQERQAAERRQAEMTNLRNRRAAVRDARIKEGTIINTGSQTSPGGSSVIGGAGGVQTQLGYNLGYYTSMDSNNQDVYAANTALGNANIAGQIAQANYQQAGAIGAIGKTIFDMGGGFKTVFGGSGGTSGTASAGTIFSGEPDTTSA